MLTAAFLVMQFIISAKAGLVNAVEGPANVRIQEQASAGVPIRTGFAGRVEILLNPGSFLRLGENSEAVLESVELTNIGVRIVSGSAIIEAATVEKDSPIRVTSGQLESLIVSAGLYRFSGNTASVLDGELRTADSLVPINKGGQITAQGDHYHESTTPSTEQATPLETWSQQRSQQIASANARSEETNSASNSQTPAYQGHLLYPGGGLPYGLFPSNPPSLTPFSFFQWYNGGYSFYQPLTPSPPVVIFTPYRVGHAAPILVPRPSTNLPRPPGATSVVPAPRPAPSRPGISRGRR